MCQCVFIDKKKNNVASSIVLSVAQLKMPHVAGPATSPKFSQVAEKERPYDHIQSVTTLYYSSALKR